MTKYKGKAIYEPAGKAAEYAAWACNFYVGCSNGCEYCYCKKGILKGAMGQDKPQLKKCFKDETHALDVFYEELKGNLPELQKQGLFFSFTTDPMLPETIKLTWQALDGCLVNKVPVKILTKRSDWIQRLIDFDNGKEIKNFSFKGKNNVAFGFTLTGHDELEPGASTNQERIAAMKRLHDAGFKTFASIEPIVDFDSSYRMIEQTLKFCDLYKVGLMSGAKYDIKEAQWFMTKVLIACSCNNTKAYLKDSLVKLTGADRFTQRNNNSSYVDSDFNIFQS